MNAGQETYDEAYIARTRNNLAALEEYLNGERVAIDCDWCGMPECVTWEPYKKPVTFENGVSWGRWWCHWFGQCEAAPG